MRQSALGRKSLQPKTKHGTHARGPRRKRAFSAAASDATSIDLEMPLEDCDTVLRHGKPQKPRGPLSEAKTTVYAPSRRDGTVVVKSFRYVACLGPRIAPMCFAASRATQSERALTIA
jgi:hypothetical protein